LGTPINQAPSGTRDYNPAFAYLATPSRVYWISDRNTQPGLYTMPATGGTLAKVTLTLESGCQVTDEDIEPWVTPDGTVLFFSAPRREQPNCNLPLNSGIRTAYYTYMDPATGQQIGSAKELTSVRTALETSFTKTTLNIRTPSLSPDFCTLYVSSDVDGSSPEYDVYSALR